MVLDYKFNLITEVDPLPLGIQCTFSMGITLVSNHPLNVCNARRLINLVWERIDPMLVVVFSAIIGLLA